MDFTPGDAWRIKVALANEADKRMGEWSRLANSGTDYADLLETGARRYAELSDKFRDEYVRLLQVEGADYASRTAHGTL